jgi:hypothetical protein
MSARPDQGMLAVSLADARERRARREAVVAAVRDADGPDEREAALNRLNAYMDELDEG